MTQPAIKKLEALSLAGRLRFLLSDSVLYGGANALSKGFAIITLPILTRFFEVDEFAMISVFNAFATFLGLLVVFGQDSAVARFYYDRENKEERRAIISESLLFQGVLTILAVGILSIGAEMISQYLYPSEKSLAILRLVVLQVPALVLMNFSSNLLKWTFSRVRYLFLTIGLVATNMLLIVSGLQFPGFSIESLFTIFLVVQTFFGLAGLWFIREWLVIPKQIDWLPKLLKYAVPYGVVCSLGGLLPNIERAGVVRLFGTEAMGIYAVGIAIAVVVQLGVSAFLTAWGPFSLAIHKREDADETYDWILRLFTIGLCVGVLVLGGISKEVVRILASSKYVGAEIFVFPLAMALGLQGLNGILQLGILISKKSYLSLYSDVTFYLLAPGLIYGCGRMFGVVGVSIGIMIGQAFRTCLIAYLSNRAYQIRWSARRVSLLVGTTMLVGACNLFSSYSIGSVGWLVSFFLLALAVGAAGSCLLISRTEWQRIREWLRKSLGGRVSRFT